MVQKAKNSPRDNQMMIIIGIIVAAVIVAGVAIFVSGNALNPSAATIDYSKVPQSRTADGAFVLGDPNAPVTVIAFEDYLCPHCQDYQTQIKKFIANQVVTGKARFEFRSLPAIDQTYSYLMAHMAECSELINPGTFWRAHDALFDLNSRVRFGPETAKTFAQQMDMDYSKLLDCATTKAGQIEIDAKYGDSLGVTGTPTIFIKYGDGQPVLQSPPPSYEQLAALVAVGSSLPVQK